MLDNLTKMYGSSRGIEQVSFKIAPGHIVGFLGPNGAGKSTTINLLMGYLQPTSGTGTIFGKDITTESVAIRKDIGFLASDMALDDALTGWEQVAYFGNLRKNFDKSYVQKLAKQLDCDLSRKTKTLSRGNRQKVGLITALMHRPKLLILDEPTSGLDPLIQAAFNDLLHERKAAGDTTFISSHVLSEVEDLCDRMIFIRSGMVVADKTMEELSKAAPKRIKIISKDKTLRKSLQELTGCENLKVVKSTIEFTYTDSIPRLVSLLNSHTFSDLSIMDSDLEETFMGYYENVEEQK